MLVSLNWIREFVEIPLKLTPAALADRFTVTCAEVDSIYHLKVGDRTAAETICQSEDWVLEIDNKSITHRPDMWGHYGIAREMAAMLELPLKPYVRADEKRLLDDTLPEIPVVIDDPELCPRYTAIQIEGVSETPSPDWMQERLCHVGIRPINALVDLTNYIMAELGQPMHAFDASSVLKVEVAAARGGEKFKTLDCVERTLPAQGVMIQSDRKNIAIAGIMGGLETEVTSRTTAIVLESATFGAAAIRRCAASLGHRTEASARFEKSLDPAHTVIGIERFVHLGMEIFPKLRLASRLSDCYPNRPEPSVIHIKPDYISSYIGKSVPFSKMKDILESLEFKVQDEGDTISVTVPSFRATRDIEGETDVIEEIARFVGYDQIEPVLPQVTTRYFKPNAMHRIQKRSLALLCESEGYYEVQQYNWNHADWMRIVGEGEDPAICLKNPPASGFERLRRSLVPGLLKAADLNRRAFPDVKMLSVGSVFGPELEGHERLHLGLLSMARRKSAGKELLAEVKSSLSRWSRYLWNCDVQFSALPQPRCTWEDPVMAAAVRVKGCDAGRLSVVPSELLRRIDEHLRAWTMVSAEIDLSLLAELEPTARRLSAVPAFPVVELDYSVLVDASRQCAQLQEQLRPFSHELLSTLTLEEYYEGRNIPTGQRSLLLRARIRHPERTLTEEDIHSFRESFASHLALCQIRLRGE